MKHNELATGKQATGRDWGAAYMDYELTMETYGQSG